jgi:hypothetical protein
MSLATTMTKGFLSLDDCADAGTPPEAEAPPRLVRFDDECVLIPDAVPTSRRPRIVTKSYSLPLWKRRVTGPASDPEDHGDEEASEKIVLSIPVPTCVSLNPHSLQSSLI